MSFDSLDELVYEVASQTATSKFNDGNDSMSYDELHAESEKWASEINNKGYDFQLNWLLERGISQREIHEYCE